MPAQALPIVSRIAGDDGIDSSKSLSPWHALDCGYADANRPRVGVRCAADKDSVIIPDDPKGDVRQSRAKRDINPAVTIPDHSSDLDKAHFDLVVVQRRDICGKFLNRGLQLLR